ncbi:hypothetical protein [Paenirhodobacter sp. CAU 1674]|uniref:hypothetical protein n=1 Tax=Paenirhodobacter sp. CAU 1674 TaxID=3032596 RepID=UPI0023DBB4F7|nr:hypothetical protein [Paenirhodobacter sp. CAU 1674]MDF2142782.1 hypothetical protein [Paenirhodobacter sp. CAU 1674]
MMRILRKFLIATGLGAGLGLVALAGFFPVLRGAICPGCYGLEQVAPGVYVEASMPPAARAALLAQLGASRAQIAAFYGPPKAHLRILACETRHCDRRLGGRGAAAVTYSLGPVSVVRLAPRGLSQTILTHELAHTETHARLGVTGQIRGRLPTWMDEGLSVLISDDPRYLGPGTGTARCLRTPRADLPSSAFDWAPLAARETWLYAEAACAVLHWADAHGGLAALRTRLESGARFP